MPKQDINQVETTKPFRAATCGNCACWEMNQQDFKEGICMLLPPTLIQVLTPGGASMVKTRPTMLREEYCHNHRPAAPKIL